MNFDKPIRYLGRVSLDAASVPNAKDAIAKVPAIVGPDAVSVATQDPSRPGELRPGFLTRSAGGSLLVVLLATSFDVLLQPTRIDETLMLVPEFLQRSGEILAQLLEIFERKAHRIAFVFEGLLPEMTAEEFSRAAAAAFSLPPLFKEGVSPFEWDWRVASHVPRSFGIRKDESTNTILTIKRQQFEIQDPVGARQSYDRVFVATDVNTDPADASERFTPSDVRAFAQASAPWHAELFDQVGVLFDRTERR